MELSAFVVAVLSRLTVAEWIMLAEQAPAIIAALVKLGQAVHPVFVMLRDEVDKKLAEGASKAEAAAHAGALAHRKWTTREESTWFDRAQGTV